MSDVPVLRSREQIIGDIVDGFLARVQGVNDLSRNSVLSQFIQAFGGSVFKSSADVIALINVLSIDNSTGEALQRLARDRNVPIYSAAPSSGRVRITDISFQKVETTVYSGQPAPVAGSLTLYVTDATKFTAGGGRIYIGRGTVNVEGPLEYTSAVMAGGGAYWIVNLASTSPTTRFHNIGEKVVMAQGGNRTIPTSSIVQTPQGSAINSASFSTTSRATIPDGEVEVTDVPVVCSNPGPIGNVPRGAIRDGLAFPFKVSVFNDNPFENGRDADQEDDIITRIKQYEVAKSKGTEAAIELAAENVTSPDDLKRVTSAVAVRYADSSCALVFDDGTGYEPIFDGAQLENVVDEALGGEIDLQLRQYPITQARVKNNVYGPYNIIDNSYLAVKVQNEITEHMFNVEDFKVPGQATASEVVNSINNDYTINFLASTYGGGSLVVLYPKKPIKNDIQVVTPSSGDNANDVLGFATNVEYTARIYRDDVQLYQDGLVASVDTKNKADWSSAITSGDTLTYTVDGTPALTIQFLSSDFQAIDPTTVMSNLTVADVWVSVFNAKMPGITAQLNGDFITFSSNLSEDNRAAIEFTGGTLLYKIFTPGQTLSATGRTPDYTLNRQTGQLSLANHMITGGKLTAGSNFTRANAITSALPNGPNVAGNVWMIIDGNCSGIPNSLLPNTTIAFSKAASPDGTFTITGTTPSSTPQGFNLVQPGDWLLVWANSTDGAILPSNTGFWRVESAQVGQLKVYDKVGYARVNGSGIFNTDRFVIVRSLAPIQQLSFTAGSLSNLVSELNGQIEGIDVDIVGSSLRLSTQTFGTNGELFFVAADSGGRNLGLPMSEVIGSQTSHYGFAVTEDSEAGMPNFTMGTFGSVVSFTDMTVTDYLEQHGDVHDFVELLDRYNATTLTNVVDSNIGRRIFVKDYNESTSALSMLVPEYIKKVSTGLQEDDRFFLRSAYQFGSTDTQTVVIDGDPLTKSYGLPVARKLLISSHSTPTTLDFSADDGESTLELNDTASFNGFDFSDFLVMRRPYSILTNGSGATDYAIKFNMSDFGDARVGIGFTYPKALTQTELTHLTSISDTPEIGIVLPITEPRTPNWNQTTAFSVEVTTVGGKDQIKYTYRAGLAPLFTVLGANVSVGDVMILSSSANFLSGNRGIEARVIDVNDTDFTVELPTGQAVDDDMAFSSIQNINKVITVQTLTPHQVNTGDRVGFWNTAPTTGTTKPMDGSYIASYVSPTSFTVQASAAVPGKAITSASHSANEITIQSTAHGLYVGNAIIISDAGGSYDGLTVVSSVDSANQFRCVKQGSSAAISSGRFDFQSYLPSTTSLGSISSVSMNDLGVVEVTTSANHGLSNGMLVNIDSVTLQSYVGGTTYGIDDLVLYTGTIYKSLQAGNTGHQPDTSPTYWAAANDKDLLGTFIISVTALNKFTYAFNHTSATPHTLTTGTGGTFTQYIQSGRLARSLGGSSAANLQFGAVSTTAQDVVDYVVANLSDRLIASLYNGQLGTAIINQSTRDLGSTTNYLTGNVSRIKTIRSKNSIELDSDVEVLIGSLIEVSGFTGGLADYNNTYTVLRSVEVVAGTTWRLTVQSTIYAINTTISTPTGITFVGYRSYVGFQDGLNSVKLTDLGSLAGSPQFTVKKPWTLAPEIDEDIRLVCVTSDHLTRFWNKLIVTGLSNVGTVKNSEYGRQIQISTQTFGGEGSVQVTGGSANGGYAALVGSASEVNDKVGVAYIPYELRHGLGINHWITLENTVRQNKTLGLSGLTAIRIYGDGVSITTPPGSFQTKRSTTQDETTRFRIEKHGDFMAIIRIAGTAIQLGTAGVQEGDWVRIRNTEETLWTDSTGYIVGDRVSWNNFNWTALDSSTNIQPGTDDTKWEVREWASSSQGIYQVVRVWGEDTFWIHAPNMISEMLWLGNQDNISFYSYDSVMPGDTVVIGTDIFGAVNMGRFTVVDEAYGAGYQFPSATRLYTTPIPTSTSSIVLGGNFNQVNVEEELPLLLYKRVLSVGPSGGSSAMILTDTPTLMNKFSSSLGAVMSLQNKLDNSTLVHYGVDAYKYYGGLVKELNRVIYGDPVNPTTYPGVRSAGTDLDIKPAILKRIILGMAIRVKIGVPFTQVKDRVRSSVAGYINGLGNGQQVSLSKIIAAAQRVTGVESVVITSPTYSATNDLIPVNPDQKAYIVDPTTDIIISVLSD